MKVLLLLSCSLVLCKEVDAQADVYFLRGYAFIAPAPNNGSPNTMPATFGILPAPQPMVPVVNSTGNTYLAGGGAEIRFARFLGAGVDLAGILPGGGKIISNTIGTFSPNGYFHVAPADWLNAKVDVYVTGGYTLLFRDFSANGFNVGGGVNYWFEDHLAINVEYRFLKVYGSPPPPIFASHYSEIRFGLTFR